MVGLKIRRMRHSVMAQSTEHYSEIHRSHLSSLPGQSVDWIHRRREDAIATFRSIGFPTPRDEDWRYTALRPITSKAFSPVLGGQVSGLEGEGETIDIDVSAFLVDDMDALRLVFIDGVYHPALSSIDQQQPAPETYLRAHRPGG